eukprot:c3339_g1_i1.p1 GENE.c3339_g1_i1~~c3339_g1_i1.p1  ORF type:complete len:273 (-),score=57.70 c3339_g1_i1:2-820(-)
MKLNKQNRRVMGFYRSTFNLDEPYHVLIDGNFLHLATARRLNMLEKLERTLGGKLKPKLTQCVVAELKMLGPEFSGAKVAAKRMHRHECNHTTSVPPAECIKSLVGKRNVGRFCVATQDRELQHELHELGGAPILFVAQSSVLLDNPPSFVKQQLLEDELKFGGLTKQERRAIAEAKKGTSTKRFDVVIVQNMLNSFCFGFQAAEKESPPQRAQPTFRAKENQTHKRRKISDCCFVTPPPSVSSSKARVSLAESRSWGGRGKRVGIKKTSRI